MSSSPEIPRLMAVAILLGTVAAQAQTTAFPGVGRAATAAEIKAWDIDVRPDFKGLPKGSGSVAKGMEVWEAKCSSCHGVFGESNQFFNPIVGGTTKEDIKTGRVARLNDAAYPGRTTMMKAPTVSTLWDYINRAMPWTAPKTLTVEEVYGVTAYILNLADVLPESFTLSDQNIADVQNLLPNRSGMTTEHGLWPGRGFGNRKPDVQAKACVQDCITEAKIASFLPDFARNAHGNLAEQNRTVGAQLGADTSKPPSSSPQPGRTSQNAVVATTSAAASAAAKPPASVRAPAAIALTEKYTCVACHGMENKIVGPSFIEVAKKHAGQEGAVAYLANKIKAGGSGVWGAIPMPPQALSEAEAKAIAQWLAEGARK